jgi:hypothetical protein
LQEQLNEQDAAVDQVVSLIIEAITAAGLDSRVSMLDFRTRREVLADSATVPVVTLEFSVNPSFESS